MSLVVAVVAAYMAAIWPVISELLHARRPGVVADAQRLGRRCSSYRWIAWVLTGSALTVALIMVPLVVDIVQELDPSASFSSLRAGVLLLAMMMVAAAITAGVLAVRLGRRAVALLGE